MISNLTFEEKIKLLPQDDKLYLAGFVDRALSDYKFLAKKSKKKEEQQNANININHTSR
ncbi:hypothetical protein PBV87_07385 [Niameybacter massiliensis]|uniref:Uncharacterized protein n=1 Tax=Holtiella tumoricola TaxID=3018743 RepID=A0AA42DLS5_9FIRM|nr:hypothetical protein [Holtiella tumoricola]MDA3731301.1 hypothetical protein [Holtiella tumoricola]